MNDGDVGVVQRRKRLGFALEPRQAIRILRERLGQHLDRDWSRPRFVSVARYTSPIPPTPIRSSMA